MDFEVLVPVLFFLAGLIALVCSIVIYIKFSRMRTWKITNGIITKVSHEYKENYDGATKLNPISVYGLEYSYKVKDQEYSGVSSMKSSINSKYKAGDKIFVVFNPEDHSQSDQYESYFKYLHFVLLVPGIVLLIAGLIILFKDK